MILEAKVENSCFPVSQFLIDGYSPPFRLQSFAGRLYNPAQESSQEIFPCESVHLLDYNHRRKTLQSYNHAQRNSREIFSCEIVSLLGYNHSQRALQSCAGKFAGNIFMWG